ncbi:MAG: fumarylacetoacetate hydrolase family protein [Arthrobacter sp.]|jgi:acylpyruvate hydrolase|nr:fumarylacetoacetate hydrolase family protein [Arthrobacter sp.]
MKLVSYEYDGARHVGELRGTTLLPLVGIAAIDADTPTALLAAAQRDAAAAVELSEATLLPASASPRKIFCVGLNYKAHVEETGRDLPSYPVLFPKFASNLLPADGTILLPPESAEVDFEGELALIIGTAGRRIRVEDAMDHVLGLTVANDISMRDYQYKTHQWTQGKAWDASTPLGPWIVSPDEVDLEHARIRTTVDGEVVQDSTLGHLIFSLPQLIATISEFTLLEPGDVILTGTPSGIGHRRTPQLFLRDGSVVTVEVEGVGSITNAVVAEAALV